MGPFWFEGLHAQVVRRTNALLGYSYGRKFREAVALGTGLHGLVGRARTLAEIGWVPLALHPRTGGVVEALVRRRAPAPRSGPAEGPGTTPVADLIGHTASGRMFREHMEVPMGGYHATAVICSQMALTLLLDADRIPARYPLPAVKPSCSSGSEGRASRSTPSRPASTPTARRSVKPQPHAQLAPEGEHLLQPPPGRSRHRRTRRS